MKRCCLLFCALVLAWQPLVARAETPARVDVLVYGGTSAGVIAAATVAKEGRTVLLVEPGRHLGGMSSGGLGSTDFGNKQVIGGLSQDFYLRVGKAYGKKEASWTFEPHVAEQVFKDIVAEAKLPVLFHHRLVRVTKAEGRIESVTLEKAPTDALNAPGLTVEGDPVTVAAGVFIDASYEGDLLARAKVSYHVGREAVADHDEPLNGIRAETPHHQFLAKVDPYLKPGDPKSGLLPLIQAGDGGKPGAGDRSVQAYNFRLCLTKDPTVRLGVEPPKDYDGARFEILARHLEALVAAGKKPELKQLLSIIGMPKGKTDVNNNGAVSTDFIGENYDYPDGDYAVRNKIWHAHEQYTRGLLHFLAVEPRVPANVRDEMNAWGLCKDEFGDTAGWPHQLYVREARRMIGRYFITQADCDHKRTVDDSVGMGAYNMDSHNCQRLVQGGVVRNEGDVQVGPRGPYPVSYRAITPKAEECTNLLVPVCLSASHIAYGSVRMEPVFMALGQSAAVAACQSLEEKKAVQEIDVPRLQKRLRDAGQVLEYSPKKP